VRRHWEEERQILETWKAASTLTFIDIYQYYQNNNTAKDAFIEAIDNNTSQRGVTRHFMSEE
jgi:hypothetical protein